MKAPFNHDPIGTCTLCLDDGSELTLELIDSFDGETFLAMLPGDKLEVVTITVPGMERSQA